MSGKPEEGSIVWVDDSWQPEGLFVLHRLIHQTLRKALEDGEARSAKAWGEAVGWPQQSFRVYDDLWRKTLHKMTLQQIRQDPSILKIISIQTLCRIGTKGLVKDDEGRSMSFGDLLTLLLGIDPQNSIVIPEGDYKKKHKGFTVHPWQPKDAFTSVEPYAEAIELLKEAIAAQGAEIDDAIDTLPELGPLLDGLRADADVLYKIAYKLNLDQSSLDRLQKIYRYSVKLKNPTPEERGGNGNGKVNGNGKWERKI